MARTLCSGRCTCNLDERQDTEHCRNQPASPIGTKPGRTIVGATATPATCTVCTIWRARRAPQLRATATAVESPMWGPPRPPQVNQTRHVARHHGTGEDRRGLRPPQHLMGSTARWAMTRQSRHIARVPAESLILERVPSPKQCGDSTHALAHLPARAVLVHNQTGCN